MEKNCDAVAGRPNLPASSEEPDEIARLEAAALWAGDVAIGTATPRAPIGNIMPRRNASVPTSTATNRPVGNMPGRRVPKPGEDALTHWLNRDTAPGIPDTAPQTEQ
jgi:hypothetical protein